MKKTFTIADQTLNRALSLGLAPADIKRIADTLQKYPVSCFDIDASTIRNYPFSYELPHSMIRYTVGLADAMPETDGNRKIRINWDHQREKGLRALGKMAQAAKSSELYLGLGNIRELGLVGFLRYMDWARKYNVHGIIYRCDGTEDVFDLTDKLLQIKRLAPCPIEFETSNTLGLAAAQSLAAIKAGACRVSASVAGMFDYSATEQVLMSAKHLWQYEIPQGKELAADFQMILSLFGIKTPANKVMIGRNVFAHESGIHVDGIIKNPSIYEVIRPEDVGLKRKLVIGKHSGTASIKSKMIQLGFQISDDEVKCLLESVRELAQFQKGPLTDQQLKDLFLKKSGGNSNGEAI